jgi:ELWxxDGT repeat protein
MRKVYLLCVAVSITSVLAAQTPALVNDIYNYQNNGSITGSAGYTAVGGTVFFTAGDGVNGIELWKTDGTAAGTKMVKDINPGDASSLPANLTNEYGMLFFTSSGSYGNNTGYDTELWKSDGIKCGINPLCYCCYKLLYRTNLQWEKADFL